MQWRYLPERCGPWKTVYERHRLRSADGTWERLLQQVQAAGRNSEAMRGLASRFYVERLINDDRTDAMRTRHGSKCPICRKRGAHCGPLNMWMRSLRGPCIFQVLGGQLDNQLIQFDPHDCWEG